MNASKIIIAALFAAASVTSMAATVEQPMPSVTVSASSQIADSGEAYMGYTGFVSTKTRAEVVQELREAQRRGEIVNGDGYPGPLFTESVKTRAEVIADLKAYRMTHHAVTDDGAFMF